jgi:hypothetical protein
MAAVKGERTGSLGANARVDSPALDSPRGRFYYVLLIVSSFLSAKLSVVRDRFPFSSGRERYSAFRVLAGIGVGRPSHQGGRHD